MVWLIKFKDGRYADGDGNRRGRAFAHEYGARYQAYEELANSWSRHEAEPRIVRLKPRAKLDEAAIRRAERERIAREFCRGGNSTFERIQAARANDGPMYGAIRDAILALDWKPGT